MSHPDAQKWDAVYAAGEHRQNDPVKVLRDHAYLLPASGTALDIACGRGSNALFLARHGLEVSAWDISEQAIQHLQEQATNMNLHIDTRVCDVIQNPPDENNFDVIVVSYFLERTLMPALIKALKPGGLLFYQTFSREHVDDTGPRNEDYRLASNELLKLCHNLHVVFYHEEELVGDTQQGFRNEVMLIGQRR